MKVKEHVHYLAKELANRGHVNLIGDSITKEYLRENSRYFYPVLDLEGKTLYSTESEYSKLSESTLNNIKERLINKAKEFGANYVFTERSMCGGTWCKIILDGAPFAVIGDLEEKILRETFYRDVPYKVREAFDELGMEHYIELYILYQRENFIENLSREFTERMQQLLTEIPEYKQKKVKLGDAVYHWHDKVEPFNWSLINETPVNLFLRVEKIDGVYYKSHCYSDPFLKKPYLIKDEKDHLEYHDAPRSLPLSHSIEFCRYLDFFEFVFRQPEEEQNPASNLEILANFADKIDFRDIMLREYKNSSEHFRDYFSVLSTEKQEEIVHIIKSENMDTKNQQINSWLFDLGYDGLYLEFLELYKNSPEGFMRYMKKTDDEMRRDIIEALYELDEKHQNPETDRLMEQNSQIRDLVEEIGIRRVKEPGDENG